MLEHVTKIITINHTNNYTTDQTHLVFFLLSLSVFLLLFVKINIYNYNVLRCHHLDSNRHCFTSYTLSHTSVECTEKRYILYKDYITAPNKMVPFPHHLFFFLCLFYNHHTHTYIYICIYIYTLAKLQQGPDVEADSSLSNYQPMMEAISRRNNHTDISGLNSCDRCSDDNAIQSLTSQRLEHETILIPPPVYQPNSNYAARGIAEEENIPQQQIGVNDYDQHSRPPSYKDHRKDIRCL